MMKSTLLRKMNRMNAIKSYACSALLMLITTAMWAQPSVPVIPVTSSCDNLVLTPSSLNRIASDNFDAQQNVTSVSMVTDLGTSSSHLDVFSSTGDLFGITDGNSSAGMPLQAPFALVDDAFDVSCPGYFASDNAGVVPCNYGNNFFGIVDSQNGDNSGAVTATWNFDISSASLVTQLCIDMGAMGDFESSSDYFRFSMQIDGGTSSVIFSAVSDDDISASYDVANGPVVLNDPLILTDAKGSRVLTNGMTTFCVDVNQTGSNLRLDLEALFDGGAEAVAFDNIVLFGLDNSCAITYNYYDADPSSAGANLLHSGSTYAPGNNAYTSPLELWITAEDCMTQESDAIQISAVSGQDLTLSCNAHLNLSANENCELPLDFDVLLEGEVESDAVNNAFLEYTLYNEDGQQITQADINDYLGDVIQFKVENTCDGNSCWGTIFIEDKLAPVLDCPADITITCIEEHEAFSTQYIADNHLTNNCGDATVYLVSDRTTDIECDDALNPNLSAIRTICYIAEDSSGNVSNECCYEVRYTRVHLFDQNTGALNIVFPAHQDLTCTNYPQWESTYDPAFGAPYISTASGDLSIYPSMGECELSTTYTDEIVPICGAQYKVLRHWLIVDWCSGESMQHTQILKVEEEGFTTLCPEVEILYTSNGDPYTCTAIYTSTSKSEFEDDFDANGKVSRCSAWEFEVLYKIADAEGNPPVGTVFTDAGVTKIDLPNGDYHYTIPELPLGCVWIRYVFTDECGVMQECSTELFVVDNTPPNTVCEEHTVVTIGPDGWGLAEASSFDDESFDSCNGPIAFGVRKLDETCSVDANGDLFGVFGGNEYFERISFCCEEIGNTVLVELVVVDDANGDGIFGNTISVDLECNDQDLSTMVSDNWNACIVEVEVEDITSPVFVCPAVSVNMDHTCDFDRDVNAGQPYYVANSQICASVYKVVLIDSIRSIPDNCGNYSVTKKWQIVNDNTDEILETCAQVINMNNVVAFTPDQITWPEDHLDLIGCAGTDTEPSALGIPEFPETGCDQLAYTYQDQVFTFVDDACFKILRTWTLIDWCQYDPATPAGPGIWIHQQEIKINDNTAPMPIAPDREFLITSNTECSVTGAVSVDGNDDCGNLSYYYTLDGGATIDTLGANNNFSQSWSIGKHVVTWIVEDMCGNTATVDQTIDVKDVAAPTPYCLSSIKTVLMPSSGTIDIWASDFDLGTVDNCDTDIKASFEDGSTSMTFGCDQLGPQLIKIVFTDKSGNSDFCEVELDVQDNSNACGNGNSRIAGEVYNELFEKADEVKVLLVNNSTEEVESQATQNGAYSFDDLTPNESYYVEAKKEGDYMNGISTLDLVLMQKHILNIQKLDSPYKIIAADINNSGHISAIDLIELRKLILGVYLELPNNESWRFLNASSQFVDEESPFPFVEVIEHDPLINDQLDSDFIAVKIGDVNNTSLLNFNSVVTENRSGGSLELIQSVNRIGEQTFEIEISSAEQISMAGLQMALDIPDAAIVKSIKGKALDINTSHFNAEQKGAILLSWNDQAQIDISENDVLFTLIIESERIPEVKTLNHQLANEAYTDALEIVEVKLRGELEPIESFVLKQNVPNPFVNQTDIEFNLPEADQVEIEVLDISGRTIYRHTNQYAKGLHTISLNASDLKAKGVLYYRFKSTKYEKTMKMVVL